MWTALGVGAASLVGGALGANATKKAAAVQAEATREQIAEQRRQYDLSRADNAPFMQTGTAANLRLRQLLLEGDTPLLRKFSTADLNADPVYQSGLEFGLNEGTKGINARAIAGGGYDSGATLKALTRFGNDYGSTKANESYNRYTADQNNIFNRLSGVSGGGQVATGQVGAAGANASNATTQALGDAGNARAASIVGGANAWNSALGGVSGAANQYQNNQFLQQLLARRSAVPNNSSYGLWD